MKRAIFSLIAIGTLTACAMQTGAATNHARLPVATAAASDQMDPKRDSSGYASAALGENDYEITYSGAWLGSRDSIEGGLLYRAALLAKERGRTWFRFLHMPGEAGPLSHPSRSAPSYGAAYGHWQPHWTYRTESGSQPWHPEWGSPFWAETLSGQSVKHVEAHAMIELGRGPPVGLSETDFDVAKVLKDLQPATG